MTDREAHVSNALERRMRDLLSSTPRAMHPIWNYILSDLVPVLRWTEVCCNSSRVLKFIQRLLKLPPLTFAFVAFAGIFMGLKKCIKQDPRFTTNLLAVAYPSVVSLTLIDSSNWMTYWCVYAWSTLTDQLTPLLQDPIKSYYIPKMLFFYWMSAKGGSSMLYHNVISRVLKRSIQSDSATRLDSTTGCVDGMIVSDDVDKNREMMEEELDDSILESVQKSENDECTFSDQDSNIDDGDSISSDKGTLENLEADVDIVSHEAKSFRNEVMFTMSSIKVSSLDKASEAAE